MQILIKNVWNNNKCWCECKNHNVCEKDYIWNPATCNCENGKYLGSVMDDSAVTCDEIISAEETHFNKKKKIWNCKTQNLCTLFKNKKSIL